MRWSLASPLRVALVSNGSADILAPLTSIVDLPNHPTLSRPLTSKALTELAEQGSGWMQKENSALWKVRPLLTKLCGDQTWAACDLMVTPNDADLFEDDFIERVFGRTSNGPASGDPTQRKNTPIVNGDRNQNHSHGAVNGNTGVKATLDTAQEDGRTRQLEADVAVAADPNTNEEHAEETLSKAAEKANGNKSPGLDPTEPKKLASEDPPAVSKPSDSREIAEHGGSNGVSKGGEEQQQNASSNAGVAKDSAGNDVEMAVDAAADDVPDMAPPKGSSNATASDMNGSRVMSVTPDVYDDPFIHPLFLAPRSAHPERDVGLPEPEAEDVRRLLQLWVQKQEEVSRGTTRLYEGLLRADRLRRTVFKWAKAEAHCGPNRDMSDGEDWYDREEWGLVEEDLKKGHDEEEEDTQQTQKKTRNRR